MNRKRLMWDVVLRALMMFCISVVKIESRSNAENHQDATTIRDWCRAGRRRCPTFEFVDKTAPVTWLADAASGMWADTLRGMPCGIERLAIAGRLTQVTWRPN